MSLFLAFVTLLTQAPVQPEAARPDGLWRAWLASPGGELPFGLEFSSHEEGLRAFLINGPERIEVPEVTLEGARLLLDLPHYASRIEAEFAGDHLQGSWSKRSGGGKESRLDFFARRGTAPRFSPLPPVSADRVAIPVDGRWRVDFSSSEDAAVGIFESIEDGTLVGTFLTTTGDYRYLAGSFEAGRLRLSCFDGAHAFLFDAELKDDRLSGDFYSRDSWHDTWTAERDENVTLPDAWEETSVLEDPALALHLFPDLDGLLRPLISAAGTGNVTLVQVFGSWCPNCHDEAPYLRELSDNFGERGLSIVGLAFELTGDATLDSKQARHYAERHGLEHPILLGGTSNKTLATQAFPALKRVLSFPTTIFIDRSSNVRAVHSGFTGPGTGEAYQELRRDFETKLDQLLDEEPASDQENWDLLAGDVWRDLAKGTFTRFFVDEQGQRRFEVREGFTWGKESRDDPISIGDLVLWGDTLFTHTPLQTPPGLPEVQESSAIWHLDRRCGVLMDATDFGRRMIPGARPDLPRVDGKMLQSNEELMLGLSSTEALERRESLYYLSHGRMRGQFEEITVDPTPFLKDEDPWVRCTAAWAAGHLAHEAARPALIESLEHGHASLRREAARALGRLPKGDAVEETLQALAKREKDYDPLVRAAVREASSALTAE